MKIKRNIVLSIAFSIILVVSTIIVVLIVIEPTDQMIEHEPILIWCDRDFNNYNFRGKGSEESPYRINNLNITTTSSKGIYITNTTKSFIISNCIISAGYAGIHIQKIATSTAQIINNTCNDAGVGILIQNSPNIIISNNICQKNDKENGIFISNSPNSLITNNTCNGNSGINFIEKNFGNGISLINSPSSILSDNVCILNSGHGISLSLSDNSIISNNRFSNNSITGLWVDYSRNSSVINNKFLNDGLAFESLFTSNHDIFDKFEEFTLDYYLSMKIEGNFVNEKPLGFYSNLTNQIITSTGDGQMIFVNCFNLTVSDLTPTEFYGVSFYYCSYSKIIGNNFSNIAKNGVLQVYSDYTLIANNTLSFNGETGIILYNSNNSTIYNNTCLSNYWGGITMIQSSNITIKQNICNNSGSTNSDGITVLMSSNITITENICKNNRNSGIETWESEYLIITNNTLINNRWGIFGGPASFFTISFNTIELSRQEGIMMITSSSNGLSKNSTITYNIFANNTSYGIAIQAGINIVIHHNSFTYNNLMSIQGFDSGSDNYWYDINLLEGNHWKDWSSGNYSIDGSAGSEDIYPLSSSPV